jgi:hypothetical protein
VWCKINDQLNCLTRNEKAAEGTLCGDNLNFVCLDTSKYNIMNLTKNFQI